MRCEVAMAVTLGVTPLLIVPHYFLFYDITPRIAVGLLGISVTLLLLVRDSIGDKLRRLWSNPLSRAFCLLAGAQVAWLLVSTIVSTHPALSWNGGNWRRLGFVSQFAVIAFACAIAAEGQALRVVLRAASAAGSAASAYGILQYFGVDPLLPSSTYHVGVGVTTIVRPPSTLGHADYFAGYLLYVVFFGAALIATESQRSWRALGGTAAILGSVAIVLSGTRGALLALAVGAILISTWKRPRIKRRHTVLAAGLCIVGVIFFLSPAGMQLRARAHWAQDDPRGGARLLLWRDSLRMAAVRPLIGFGPETFGLEFPRYQSVALSRAYPDFYHESPHNILLDALTSQGLLGLAFFAGFAALGWIAARSPAGRNHRATPYLLTALLAGMISGFFIGFTFTGFLYFYVTIALLIGFAIPAIPLQNSRTPAAVLIPACACVAVFLYFLYFTAQATASDLLLARAKYDLDTGRIADAVIVYAKSQQWHTAGSSDDLYFSRALAAASRSASPQAFAIAKRAVETSEERQNAWYNLAGFYATRNDVPGVEMCLRRSAEASPNWFKPHWAMAQVLLLSGQRAEATAEAARVADLDGAKDPEIAKFLQSLHDSRAVPQPK
jgi:O-antigen ligase